jgi:VIT1/CCC1 family predicted Fe2+/Mn2+ transporter
LLSLSNSWAYCAQSLFSFTQNELPGDPVLTALIALPQLLVPLVVVSSLGFLAILGAFAARIGGAGIFKPTVRVTVWGALAMAVTSAIGLMFGAGG